MSPGSAKRILIAPLDWGLGHTTRCVPIIRRLISRKCEVIFSGNDTQQTFVKRLFPNQQFRYLPGYNVRYGTRKVLPALLPQLPGLVKKVAEEHQWLLSLCAKEPIDGIISDNRYGLWHPEIPSVIMTHQAQVLSGMGRLADKVLLRLHGRMLRRFGATWIVDVEGEGNLGGRLSQSAMHWPDTRFIGWLSQFEDFDPSMAPQHILILLSGPEPQRTMLSDLLWKQVSTLNRNIVFVEGKAGFERQPISGRVRHFSRTSGPELQKLLEQASVVVCRSGYSSLMDLLLFQKPALLIPTPGQTEQEFLARRLHEMGHFGIASQHRCSLETDLDIVPNFSFPIKDAASHYRFITVLDEWLDRI